METSEFSTKATTTLLAEALLIKKHKPSLNVQEKSVKLELFN